MEKYKILALGFGAILFGILCIWFTHKTKKNDELVSTSFKGYTFGFLCVFIGILYALRKFNIINW
jgi:hypothetical protein